MLLPPFIKKYFACQGSVSGSKIQAPNSGNSGRVQNEILDGIPRKSRIRARIRRRKWANPSRQYYIISTLKQTKNQPQQRPLQTSPSPPTALQDKSHYRDRSPFLGTPSLPRRRSYSCRPAGDRSYPTLSSSSARQERDIMHWTMLKSSRLYYSN